MRRTARKTARFTPVIDDDLLDSDASAASDASDSGGLERAQRPSDFTRVEWIDADAVGRKVSAHQSIYNTTKRSREESFSTRPKKQVSTSATITKEPKSKKTRTTRKKLAVTPASSLSSATVVSNATIPLPGQPVRTSKFKSSKQCPVVDPVAQIRCIKKKQFGGKCASHGGGKRCKAFGCTKLMQRPTDFCVGHGGGRRCEKKLCTNSAVGTTTRCKQHGGGRRCEFTGCTKPGASETHFCMEHGGGKRCTEPGCPKSAICGKAVKCKAHGGGVRCQQTGCPKSACPGTTQLCREHGGGMCEYQGGNCKVVLFRKNLCKNHFEFVFVKGGDVGNSRVNTTSTKAKAKMASGTRQKQHRRAKESKEDGMVSGEYSSSDDDDKK